MRDEAGGGIGERPARVISLPEVTMRCKAVREKVVSSKQR